MSVTIVIVKREIETSKGNISLDSFEVQLSDSTDYAKVLDSILSLESFIKSASNNTPVSYSSEMIVLLANIHSMYISKYVFEYTQESLLDPRSWIVNNILYCLNCHETKKRCPNAYCRVEKIFIAEYQKTVSI